METLAKFYYGGRQLQQSFYLFPLFHSRHVTLVMIKQAFREENMSRTQKSKLTTTEKGETGEEQSQEHCSSFSLTSRELFTKNSSWQAKQSISYTTVMFYDDCVKMCKYFAPNFRDKRTGYFIMTAYHLTLPFSPRNF
jgi:hypothetical protein